MRKFFKCSDDFFSIISSQIGKPKSVKLISTGWTNFVYIAKSKKGKFVFRFPRNHFFSQAIVKECEFLKQLTKFNKNLPIPDLQLCFYKNKPYSMHKYISGKAMDKCKFFSWQKRKLAKDIVNFLFILSKFKPDIKLPKTSTFLARLSKVSGQDGYDLSKHKPLIQAEKKCLVLSHGDLNPGNIIIRNGKLKAIVDFAFVSYSSPLDDITRLTGRLDGDFKKYLFPIFENKFGLKVKESEIKALKSVWYYVEYKYVGYIKVYHRDIVLPKQFS